MEDTRRMDGKTLRACSPSMPCAGALGREWCPSMAPQRPAGDPRLPGLGLRVAEEPAYEWPPASRPARESRVPKATRRHGLPPVPPPHGMPASGRGLHHLQVQLQFVDVLLLRRDMRFEHRP